MPRTSRKTAPSAAQRPARNALDRPIATTGKGQPLAALTSAIARAGSDVQQHIARSGGLLQQEAARKLRHATNPAEFFAVQAAFVLASWQQSVECSSIVAQAWTDALRAPNERH